MFEKKRFLAKFYDVDGTEKQLWVYAENKQMAKYKAFKELKGDNFFERCVTFGWFLKHCLIGISPN